VITPDPSFRPNPNRAIYLQGEINQSLLDRHTSDIIKLKHGNQQPITVYIDSNGGDPTLGERLLKLLLASGQDSDERGNLITVVTAQAASAAADLLSSGDYAIAYRFFTTDSASRI
jgi:ATP-dependent protease ClpP protease subunit